ncbi:MAG: DUF554 domain-containing protein [Oscillospiraceae bacterium]|nr:DUF554 domain-containing protein [Oscillospiraceae bacterium]
MLAVFINVATVLIGSTIGLIFGSRIKENYTQGIMMAIALCTFVIGVQSAIQTSNILIVMVCLVIGTVIGVWLKLDDRMNGASDRIKERLKGTKLGKGPFAEAFMTTTMLFCVGTMTVIGSIEAGLNHHYDILIAKSIMDLMSSLIFAAALGAGVLLSAVSVLVIQGGIALLASVAAPILTTEVVTEMSAVGGTLFIGMAINLMGISHKHIKIGDMLPAIFLPILYFPLAAWIGGLF